MRDSTGALPAYSVARRLGAGRWSPRLLCCPGHGSRRVRARRSFFQKTPEPRRGVFRRRTGRIEPRLESGHRRSSEGRRRRVFRRRTRLSGVRLDSDPGPSPGTAFRRSDGDGRRSAAGRGGGGVIGGHHGFGLQKHLDYCPLIEHAWQTPPTSVAGEGPRAGGGE